MQWLNEAPEWAHTNDRITMVTAPETDFWRITHDNGTRDSGHFYYQPVRGDFTATVRFSGAYTALYDQAGLMLRLDDKTWIKAGIELFEGVQQASVVVTRGMSDWSVLPLADAPQALMLRLERHAHTVEVAYSVDGSVYTMLRQAYFPPEPDAMIGVMACSPTGTGFRAQFEDFTVTPRE